jgi:hypothetical protein
VTLPAGFGYNVVTLTWLQTGALEVGIALGVWTIYRVLRPIIERQAKIVRWIDSLTETDTEADRELAKVREGRRGAL